MLMKKSKKKMFLAMAVANGGLNAAVTAGHVTIYDKIFARYERPDYSVIPGIVCVDRLDSSIRREEISFYSGDVLLKGNYFSCDNPKGIVLMAHGIHAGGDDYLNIVLYFLEKNYNVFSFNYRGVYDSEGDSCVGFCESLIDVNHAINYISSHDKYNRLPLFLFGHSWGGYAVTSVLSLQNKVKACAAVAGMHNGFTMIIDKAKSYVGDFAEKSRPIFESYQKFLFGNYVNYDAVTGINNSNIPVVIAHGFDDKVIVFSKESIVSRNNEIKNSKLKYYFGKGLQGSHNGIMFSNEAIIYQQQLKDELKSLEKEKGRKLTQEELQEFYKDVNHERYSEVNRELMDLILETFDLALKQSSLLISG